MKRSVIAICMFAAGVLSLTGCDFFRTLAGRPTSAQLERKKQEILRVYEEQKAAEAAAAALEAKQKADSLAFIDSVRALKHPTQPLSSIAGTDTKLKNRYYIVTGAYEFHTNASRQFTKAKKAGYDGQIIENGFGRYVVLICPSNDLVGTVRTLEKIRGSDFCPKDAWILENR